MRGALPLPMADGADGGLGENGMTAFDIDGLHASIG